MWIFAAAMLHTIKTKQLIKNDLDTVWEFISNPKNLSTITPPGMSFQILSDPENTNKMHAGQIIEYYVKPIGGIKMHWVTEITQVVERKYFIDEQRFGPYAFWHHQHSLTETPQGIEMHDLIHYKLPLGILGRMANLVFVKQKLEQIFDYRYKKIHELFNNKS
jgi:ligand-binding SRPBCC domain-containing protein